MATIDDLPVPRPRSRLGVELRRLRMSRGLSQRELARLVGLSSHSNFGDYERGTRIPPKGILTCCERVLGISPGTLEGLRQEALGERADAWVLSLAGTENSGE